MLHRVQVTMEIVPFDLIRPNVPERGEAPSGSEGRRGQLFIADFDINSVFLPWGSRRLGSVCRAAGFLVSRTVSSPKDDKCSEDVFASEGNFPGFVLCLIKFIFGVIDPVVIT